MRKSRSITLTMVTAAAMASAQAPAPAKPVDPNSCDQILKNAGAGAAIPSRCIAGGHNGFVGARAGGFGATARGHHSGGS